MAPLTTPAPCLVQGPDFARVPVQPGTEYEPGRLRTGHANAHLLEGRVVRVTLYNQLPRGGFVSAGLTDWEETQLDGHYTMYVDVETNCWLLRREGGYLGLQAMTPSQDDFLTPTPATVRYINYFLWQLLLWQLTVRAVVADEYVAGQTHVVNALALYGDRIAGRPAYLPYGGRLLYAEYAFFDRDEWDAAALVLLGVPATRGLRGEEV